MLERKIAMTRNLLLAVIILCLVLGGVVVYQGQEIKKTRETLNAMQRQAENAVGQFMPQPTDLWPPSTNLIFERNGLIPSASTLSCPWMSRW